MMHLKGYLWHQGINGLGVGPMWLRRWLPYRKTFDAAARKHDEWYDTKGDGWARELDDLLFLYESLKVSKTPMQRFFAYLYFLLVRMVGWMFYRYNKQIKDK